MNSRRITEVIRNIFRINLGVRKRERVLVFHDKASRKKAIDPPDRRRMTYLRDLSLMTGEIGSHFSHAVTVHVFPSTGNHGIEPPSELWELAFGPRAVKALRDAHIFTSILKKRTRRSDLKKAEEILKDFKNDSVDCVIALSHYSTSHTRFRDFLTRVCGTRYASMPLFDPLMLEGAMNVDWKALARRTKEIAKIVNPAETIRVSTPNGTALSFSKKGRKAISDTGILTRAGAFGNLPAGEVYLAPREGTACGRLFLEWAPTRPLQSPVELEIKDGYVTAVSGADPYVNYLRTKLSEHRDNGNIAEFGIGTNNAAKRPDNILESEKILGTIHIALGDNHSFGGHTRAPFHLDSVFFRPTVTLVAKDGTTSDLLDRGMLLC
jgi:leucyl aminopeptidase (aminopeptidase T)